MKIRIHNISQRLLTVILCSTILFGCDNSNDPPRTVYNNLVWADEFDGTTGDAPNPNFWNYDIGTGSNGWGNNELQYYTNRPENVSLDGKGNLVITAIREPFQGRAYTSARIKTKGLKEFKYGRIEARLKTPFGQGLWPAFWMLGADIDVVGWPQTGEIDIMELRGQQPRIIVGSIHGPGYSGGNAISKTFELLNSRFDTEFHVFAIEWSPDYIDFFVDNRLYQRLTPASIPKNSEWVFDKPFFLLLNVAVGGDFLGAPLPSTRFPQTMTIDYIRVYQ